MKVISKYKIFFVFILFFFFVSLIFTGTGMASDPWFSDYSNFPTYGQSNLFSWPEVNTLPIYSNSSRVSAFYEFPFSPPPTREYNTYSEYGWAPFLPPPRDNIKTINQDDNGETITFRARDKFEITLPETQTFNPSAVAGYRPDLSKPFSEDPWLSGPPINLPNLSTITYNPITQTYNAPGLEPPNSPLRVNSYIGGPGWSLFLFENTPMSFHDGIMETQDGSFEIETITPEDDGRTIDIPVGEQVFRIILPIPFDDNFSRHDHLIGNKNIGAPGPGWEDESRWEEGDRYIYGFEPLTTGLKKNEEGDLVQKMIFRIHEKSPNTKELIYNYYSPGDPDIKDTFSVTINIID